MSDIAVSINKIKKQFHLPNEREDSLKFRVINKMRGKYDKGHSEYKALKGISLDIKKGEFIGILGRNGAGKSTLLKIIAEIYQPTSGSIKVNGKLVPFIELGVGFNPNLSGRDNVYLNGAMLGFTRKEVDKMYDSIVEFAELEQFMDQKLKNYSSGMQVRLAFSVAIKAEADILLVDEVLAVGDADFQRKCFNHFQSLKGSETTVIFVTHDMNAVREYCDRALLIEKSEVVAIGTADSIANKYTKLFIEGGTSTDTTGEISRWGDKAATFDRVVLEKTKLKKEDDLIFKTIATAQKDISGAVFGFLIKNAAGANILGTNTVIEKHKIKDLKKGEKITVSWKVPNIFNDGVHFIEPAIVYQGTTQVADWWEKAAKFTVFREQKTPYIVNPPITLEVGK